MRRFRKTIRDPSTLGGRKNADALSQFDRVIDLHGMTSVEAIRVVEGVIGSSRGGSRILFNHGKGTGTLRSAIRRFCSEAPGISKVRNGEDMGLPGGDGLTAVET